MNLTEEQLSELENMAGLFFSLEDILLVLNIPIENADEIRAILAYSPEHPVHKAYQRGRLSAAVELRQAVKQAALNGSNPAQISMIEFFKQSTI